MPRDSIDDRNALRVRCIRPSGFLVAFGLLMLFMALVQPIWCVVDCAIDGRRGTAGKVVWILLLISCGVWPTGSTVPLPP